MKSSEKVLTNQKVVKQFLWDMLPYYYCLTTETMKNVHLISNFSKEIFNVCQQFDNFLPKAHTKNLREVLRGMLISGSVQLSKIAEANATGNNVRKDVERYSTFLGKIENLSFSEIHTHRQIKNFQDEPVLLLSDGGDFQKPYAKQMENVCQNVDGSNGHKVGQGYPLQSIVAYGTDSQKVCPLVMHLFSNQAEDYKSDWEEHKKAFGVVSDFINASNQDRIIVEDRGCDDAKRFIYFLKELQCSFITRIGTGKKSRGLILKDVDGNETVFNVAELGQKLRGIAGAKRTWFNPKTKKELISKIAFQKVFLPNHKEIPLYAIFVYSEDYTEPLVVLTDLITENAEQAWTYFFYYKKRWEVENFYRSIKQNFSAEDFLILGYKKIQALAFLLAFAFSLILKLKRKIQDFLGTLYIYFKNFCKKTQRTGEHYLDLLHYLRTDVPSGNNAYSDRLQNLRNQKNRKKINKNQPSLFDWRKKW